MSISFLPAVLPLVLDWSRDAYQSIWSALDDAQRRSRNERAPLRLSSAALVRLSVQQMSTQRYLAISAAADEVVVIAAGEALSEDSINIYASHLERMNWRSHLLSFDASGLNETEFFNALYDVAASLELRDLWAHTIASSMRDQRTEMEFFRDKAQPWHARAARASFNVLLDAASEQPQVIGRPDGQRIYLMSEKMLEAYSVPKSARDLVRAFSDPPADMAMAVQPRSRARGQIAILDASIDRDL